MATNNKISVKEFIKKINVLGDDSSKNDYLLSMVKDIYVPYEKKVGICERIIDVAFHREIKDLGKTFHRETYINSSSKYMLYKLNLIDNYTNIKIDFKNALEEFNELNKYGYLYTLCNSISYKELEEFDMLLNIANDDFLQNEYEPHAFIKNQVERFGKLTGVTLTPVLNQLADSIEKLDETTVDKLLNGLKTINKTNKFKVTK